MNWRWFGRVMSLANSWITRGPVSNINRLGLQWRLDHPTTLDTSSKTIISKGNPESHRTTARSNPTNLNKPPVICDIAVEITHLVQWFSYKNRDCPQQTVSHYQRLFPIQTALIPNKTRWNMFVSFVGDSWWFNLSPWTITIVWLR